MQATPDPAPQRDEPGGGGPVGMWHVAGLAVIVVGIIVLVLIVHGDFNDERDTVTGVLGVVVPAFATIGAALFGVSVGYGTGKENGKAAGKAEGEANKQEAVDVARKRTAGEIKERLRGASPAVDNLHQQISTALESPPGVHGFALRTGGPGDAPVEIGVDDLHSAKRGVEDALRRCDEILKS